ncbi:MAG: hypothetical protein DRO11_00015 [Methanobacteriota archaeon]|nr:MAG: hypothetical protein DRO11_00015 [Euryarchaeota archaeon]
MDRGTLLIFTILILGFLVSGWSMYGEAQEGMETWEILFEREDGSQVYQINGEDINIKLYSTTGKGIKVLAGETNIVANGRAEVGVPLGSVISDVEVRGLEIFEVLEGKERISQARKEVTIVVYEPPGGAIQRYALELFTGIKLIGRSLGGIITNVLRGCVGLFTGHDPKEVPPQVGQVIVMIVSMLIIYRLVKNIDKYLILIIVFLIILILSIAGFIPIGKLGFK